VKHVTGVPIKFIGTGEQLDALEPFRPEGMASRILGMGDIVALASEAQKLVDEKEQKRLQEQLEKGEFSLEDFRDHMQKMAKPGLMQKMLGLLPGIGSQLREVQAMMASAETSKEIRRLCGIVDSMTPAERRNPKLVDVSRKQRIATGAGVQPKHVSELIKQYEMMKPMLTGMAGGNTRESMQMVEQMKQKMLDPSVHMQKQKKSTGKRLTDKEREKLRKQREKFLRNRKKEK
jgi:signal recognition particle subunit SRP54